MIQILMQLSNNNPKFINRGIIMVTWMCAWRTLIGLFGSLKLYSHQ